MKEEQEMTQSVIKSISRLQNSKMGNPRFHIEMEDGTKAATLSNAGWAYEIRAARMGGEAVQI